MASSVPTLSSYLARITSEYANKPKFVAYVTALVQPLIDAQAFLRTLITAFDLDTAIGAQLDAVGLWVGRSRFVEQPLANIYFSLDTTGLGFDQGVWYGPYDPTEGLTQLDDDTYRQLLRAKVILNSWNGLIPEAAQAIGLLLNNPSSIVSVLDNQDMTMTVGISGVVPSPLITALLQGGYLPINPEGVGVNYAITSINSVAIFGFDTENATISGFDVGAWGGALGAGPGAVQGLAIVSFTNTSVTLSFIAPATGVGPYTYQAQYVQGNGTSGIWKLVGSPTSNTVITVSGLQPGTEYAFEVYAVNPSGPGPVSAPIVQTTSVVGTSVSALASAQVQLVRAAGAAAVVQTPTASGIAGFMAISAIGSGGDPASAVSTVLTIRAAATVSTTVKNSAFATDLVLPVSAVGSVSVVVTPQMVVNSITGATHTSSTPVSGSIIGFTSTPSLQYVLDPTLPAVSGVTETPTSVSVSMSWSADQPVSLGSLPSGAVITQTAFSFTLPATTAGSHTLYVVANGTVVGSTTFSVS